MNKSRLRITAVAIICTLCIASLPAARAFTKNNEQAPFITTFSKVENPGAVVTFSQEDFSAKLSGNDTLEAIVVNALPPAECGVLKIAGAPVSCGEGFSASAIDTLSFEPAANSNIVHTTFSFVPVFRDYGAGNKSVSVGINLDPTENNAPVARDMKCETYKDLELRAEFDSHDPDGDTFELTVITPPKKGEIEVLGNIFVYSPKPGEAYKDSFTYCAVDVNGNSSEVATVKIAVTKRDTKDAISYSDLSQSTAHFSAIKLAEAGVFSGTSIGSTRFLEPEKSVSRAEFISMVMAASNIAMPTSAISSGLADDAQIPPWAKATAAAALNSGIVFGSPNGAGSRVLRADDPITTSEAAALLDRAAKLPSGSDTSTLASSASVPAWAAQSVNNALSSGVISTNGTADAIVTREQAVKMIYSATQVENAQSGGYLSIK